MSDEDPTMDGHSKRGSTAEFDLYAAAVKAWERSNGRTMPSRDMPALARACAAERSRRRFTVRDAVAFGAAWQRTREPPRPTANQLYALDLVEKGYARYSTDFPYEVTWASLAGVGRYRSSPFAGSIVRDARLRRYVLTERGRAVLGTKARGA